MTANAHDLAVRLPYHLLSRLLYMYLPILSILTRLVQTTPALDRVERWVASPTSGRAELPSSSAPCPPRFPVVDHSRVPPQSGVDT